MMNRILQFRICVLCFGALIVLLSPAHAAEGNGQDARRAQIEQKLKLAGQLLASERMRQALASDIAEVRAQAEKVLSLVNQARQALAANDLKQAGDELDNALRSVSAAAKRPAMSAPPEPDDFQTRLATLRDQVRVFRNALLETSKDAGSAAAAGAAIEKADSLTEQSSQLATTNNFLDANKLLREAYLVATHALSTLRSGQTVILSLKFDTPADEYAYEEKVNLSHAMLVERLTSDGKANGAKRALIDEALEENRNLKLHADHEAKSGNHASAIKSLEQATLRLKRTLQHFGVPVF